MVIYNFLATILQISTAFSKSNDKEMMKCILLSKKEKQMCYIFESTLKKKKCDSQLKLGKLL